MLAHHSLLFLFANRKKVEKKIKDKQELLNKTVKKVQEMQSLMQKAAAEAAKAAAQQAVQG